jgi:hypothetical protein
MPAPILNIVRFRMDHEHNYGNNEPIMKLISKKGYVTTGFLRGTGLAIGQIVQAQTSDGLHHWAGWITAQGLPDWSGNLAWYFVLYAKKESTGEGSGGDVTVTVTVTDPSNPTQPGSLPATPTPQISDVP